MSRSGSLLILFAIALTCLCSCTNNKPQSTMDQSLSAKEILGNPAKSAISFGGYRLKSRDVPASVEELKEDLLILNALGIHIIRNYQTQVFKEANNLLKAIDELNKTEENFKMYVMLGAWMECKDALTDHPNHKLPNKIGNDKEIQAAIAFAKQYPEIIKVIAVGNESMVHWAPYHLHPKFILEEVLYLQSLKESGELPKDLWITSSDNFAAWGGGGKEYHSATLDSLINAVDYLSVHTYPFHDTHYNPSFWLLNDSTKESSIELIDSAMEKAAQYAISQYKAVESYVKKIGAKQEIHVGETGWASRDRDFYGPNGSGAADEYKQKLYYQKLREWSNANGISCFFFEAFDEPWKDSTDAAGSENHFGLFTVDGKAKYVLWDKIDSSFNGLGRNGKAITKTFEGSDSLLKASILKGKNY